MRTYRVYDHRLKRAISLTGDPNLFPELLIPRSTALGWIRRGVPNVVTTEEFNQDFESLLIENQNLRNELARTKATQRLQSFTFKLFGLQIQYQRLPEADSKAMLLRAIKAASRTIGLAIALRAIGLSAARFHGWLRRQRRCELEDQPSCPRITPTKLTARERMTLRHYATNPKLAHVSTSGLARLAKRRGALFASATTWCRMVREGKFRPVLSRLYPAKPKTGIRAKLPGEILHVDLTILRLVDGSRVFIQAVIDNASRYILSHCVATDYGGLRTRELLLEALGKAKQTTLPNVFCDSGTENLNSHVDSLVEGERMTRTVAQIDVAFSNSMIEAFFRQLKHSWLFVHRLRTVNVVKKLTQKYIDDHNELIPHSALSGATPAEAFHGNWSEHDQSKLDDRGRAARNARMKENRDAQCGQCPRPVLVS